MLNPNNGTDLLFPTFPYTKDVPISANTNHKSVSHKCKVVTGPRNLQFDERI